MRQQHGYISIQALLSDRTVIDLRNNDPNERAADTEPAHGWAIYTVEPLQEERVDQEYTIRYDWYTLFSGEIFLVVTHVAPGDDWIEEREKGNRFRDGIEFPEQSDGMAITPLAGDERHMRRTLTVGIPRIWI